MHIQNIAIQIHVIVAQEKPSDPWQIIDTAKSPMIAKGKVTNYALDNPGPIFAYATINRFGDMKITDYQKRGWIERRNTPIGGAVSGLVNNNDDCLRG